MELAVATVCVALASERPPSGLAVADTAPGLGPELRDRVAQTWINKMFGYGFPEDMTADHYLTIFRFGYVVALAVAALGEVEWEQQGGGG